VEDVFCGKCGKPVQEELKCVGCGTKVEPGDVFCRKCGARLVT
jgi:DNA-directed RNA polymerase subunit RPC12/RpoP